MEFLTLTARFPPPRLQWRRSVTKVMLLTLECHCSSACHCKALTEVPVSSEVPPLSPPLALLQLFSVTPCSRRHCQESSTLLCFLQSLLLELAPRGSPISRTSHPRLLAGHLSTEHSLRNRLSASPSAFQGTGVIPVAASCQLGTCLRARVLGSLQQGLHTGDLCRLVEPLSSPSPRAHVAPLLKLPLRAQELAWLHDCLIDMGS